MLHVRCSKTGALVLSVIVCCALTFTLIGIAYGRRKRLSAAQDMMSITSVKGGTATVNELAADLSWREQTSGRLHHLSEFRGKPVILCFGSATCGPFRTSLNLVEQVYRQNKGRLMCLLVYTKEAHPELGRETYMRDAHSWEDRAEASCDLKQEAQITMPIVVDTLDNRAATTFAAHPSRMYVLDPKGKIVFASGEYPASDMARGAVSLVKGMIDLK